MTINLNCGIYQIRNIITNYCYSGQSIHLKQRPSQHWNSLKNNKHKNSHLQNSYNKHGRDSFVFEILIYCAPKYLTYCEQLFCDIDKSHGLSYNIRDCVDSNRGIKFSYISRKKMSGKNHPMWGKRGKDSPLFGRHHSDESKEKMAEMQNGENNHNFGKHFSKETRKKISENHVGMLGKTHSDETCNKMSNAQKGEKNHNFGQHFSEETCKKMSEVRSGIKNYNILKKEIVLKVLELLEKGISGTEISKEIHVSRSTISKVKNGWYNDIYDL